MFLASRDGEEADDVATHPLPATVRPWSSVLSSSLTQTPPRPSCNVPCVTALFAAWRWGHVACATIVLILCFYCDLQANQERQRELGNVRAAVAIAGLATVLGSIGGDYLTAPLLTTTDFLRAASTPEVWIFAAITTAAGAAFSSSLNARGRARDEKQYEEDLRTLRQAAAKADAAADAAAEAEEQQ